MKSIIDKTVECGCGAWNAPWRITCGRCDKKLVTMNFNNENIVEFDDLEFRFLEGFKNGIQAIVRFDNGLGASVVQSEMSYGGSRGLYEVAVLDKDGEINYDTEITDDVLGYLTKEQVSKALRDISEL